ncbi:hypothetical protein F5Y15DRAFT_234077 [Xylariaceae sp. FL0016]|nr:hypothetical protein F5Y15DRAFT_234077 [Xylariaceae sp. FL0016]
MDDPSRILAQAREHLEALRQAGLSKDDLLALIEEEPQQPHQPQHHVATDPSAVSNLSHTRDVSNTFQPGHQYRSSVSTIASTASRDSCFSTASGRSSVSSTGSTSEAKFWCTSCDKTFKRKFDWKRHEEEFHDRSRKYPCNSCNQSFWGPNTFNQHHKSAHGCKTCPHADTVVKHMRKRKAYGCGFCAAMHRQFERHIDHVAGHFEAGSTKNDWLHSNVIYGLLHQHGIHETWKALIASKQNQFNGHQPMFSWSPESTGRAQGFVENESPGQLQDLLEFYDGSKEAAEQVVEMADTCVHVVLRPKEIPLIPGIDPSSPSNSHKHISVMPKMRRAASTSAMSRPNRLSRRAASTAFDLPTSTTPSATPTPMPSVMVSPPPPQPMNDVYPTFLAPAPAQPLGHPSYAEKALPPPPLDPVSPMEIDFQMPSFDQGTPSFLTLPDQMGDWQSFTSTIVEDPSLNARGFPINWEDLGQFDSTRTG